MTAGRVAELVRGRGRGMAAAVRVLFLISAQLQAGVSERPSTRSRAAATRSPAATSSCSAPTARTATRSTSRNGPARADSIMLLHAAFGSVRKLSIPRDAEAEIPGHGTQKINAAYALGGARADHRHRRELHRQRAQDQPRDRGQLRELPGAHRRVRRDTVNTRRASARRSSTTSGRASSPQGRAASSTARGRSASRACARTTARRARTTSTAPSASSRCCRGSATGCSRRRLLPAAAGSPGTRPRRSSPTWAPGALRPVRRPTHRETRTTRRAEALVSRLRARVAASRSPRASAATPSTGC